MPLPNPHPGAAGELRLARGARLFGRALLLRCPSCGTRGIFASWTRLRDRCAGCGVDLERRESDYFMGAYLFNLVAVELLLALVIVVVLVASPADMVERVWDVMEYVAPLLMLAGAVFCYPFAKATWLAVDLFLRPFDDQEIRGPGA